MYNTYNCDINKCIGVYMILTKENTDAIYKLYPVYGGIETARILGIDYKIIKSYVGNRKIKIGEDGKNFIKNSKMLKDTNVALPYLKIQTPRVAYICGFLWADGSFQRVKEGGCISLEIKKDDINDIISLFTDDGWKIYNRKRYNWKEISAVKISNPVMFNIFEKMGYVSGRYDMTTAISYIPEDLRKHWIHGLFDGDGCMYVNMKNRCRQLCISGSYNTKWNSVIEWAEQNNIYFKETKTIYKNTNRSSALRATGKESICNFYNLIYDGNIEGLKRKHDKFEQIRYKNESHSDENITQNCHSK